MADWLYSSEFWAETISWQEHALKNTNHFISLGNFQKSCSFIFIVWPQLLCANYFADQSVYVEVLGLTTKRCTILGQWLRQCIEIKLTTSTFSWRNPIPKKGNMTVKNLKLFYVFVCARTNVHCSNSLPVTHSCIYFT